MKVFHCTNNLMVCLEGSLELTEFHHHGQGCLPAEQDSMRTRDWDLRLLLSVYRRSQPTQHSRVGGLEQTPSVNQQ